MELLLELEEKNVFPDGKNFFNKKFTIRKASRGVIFNAKRQVAVLYVSKDKYYKLPGGGIEEGEENDPVIAFSRELKEETGCDTEVTNELGVIIEYRNKQDRLQISYCYIGRVVLDTGEPAFTKKELDKGFVLKWVSLDEAINLVKNSMTDDYSGRFIKIRDLFILEKVKGLIIPA